MTTSILTFDTEVDIFLYNRIHQNISSVFECGNCRSDGGAKSNTGIVNVVPKSQGNNVSCLSAYVRFELALVSKTPALLKSVLGYIARLSFRFPVEIMHVITRVSMPQNALCSWHLKQLFFSGRLLQICLTKAKRDKRTVRSWKATLAYFVFSVSPRACVGF